MKISTRLNLLSAFLLCGYLFMFLYTSFSVKILFKSMNTIHQADEYMASLNSCDELLLRQLAEGQRILLLNRGEIAGNLLVNLRLQNSKLSRRISELQLCSGPEGTSQNSELISSLSALYQTINSELIKKIFANEAIDPAQISELLMKNYTDLQNSLSVYEAEVKESIEKTVGNNLKMMNRFLITFLILLFIMAVMLILTVIFLKLFVLGTISSASKQMTKLSDGTANLNFRFKRITQDEMGELCSGFNNFIENLEEMMFKVQKSGSLSSELGSRLEADIYANMELTEDFKLNVDNLNSFFSDLSKAISDTNNTAGEVYKNFNAVKSISESQELFINETSHNIDKTIGNLVSIRNDCSSNIENTSALVGEAITGFTIINNLNVNIESILKSAEDLFLINEIIDDISSRTNILGINAAIEAAKAGHSGDGFRVVSSEISKLATIVKNNAGKTDQSLKSVVSAISKLKAESNSGKIKFKLLENNALIVFSSMKNIFEKLIELETDENNMIGSLNKLSLNGTMITDSISRLDENISLIFQSINSLEEDFCSASANIADVERGAEDLSALTKRLHVIGEENHLIADSLKSNIDHFSAG